MAVFTKLTIEDVTQILANYNIGELICFEEIASGTVNSSFYVTTTQNKYVLSILETIDKTKAEQILNLTNFLSEKNFPCPKPILDKNNQLINLIFDKPYTIVSFIAGKQIIYPTISEVRVIGDLLAKLHLATIDYPLHFTPPMNHAWRNKHAAVIKNSLPTEQDKAWLTQATIIDSQIQWDTLPKAMIHADLFRDNILAQNHQINGIIDFYYAGFDCKLWDLAVVINDWATNWQTDKITLNQDYALSILSAYQAVLPLNTLEINNLASMLQVASMHFWMTRAYDRYIGRDGILIKKDPNAYRDIFLDRLNNPINWQKMLRA